MAEEQEKDIAIRAIECYLTWTPRDRRHEIATQILKALEIIGFTHHPSSPMYLDVKGQWQVKSG